MFETHTARISWTDADGEEQQQILADRTRDSLYNGAHIWAQGRSLDLLPGKYRLQYLGYDLTLSTDELQVGDIVLHHGMRVRLDTGGELKHHPGVWHFTGTVLNLDEVLAEGHVPWSFLTTHRWDEDEHQWVIDRNDVWTVQGNELATWVIEPRTDQPEPAAKEGTTP